MKRIIITAIGSDAPGLVNKITSIINQNNGNIENSKMIKIKDQFAMIVDFSILENLDSIKSELNNIKDLNIFYQFHILFVISLYTCQDQIIQEVIQKLEILYLYDRPLQLKYKLENSALTP